MRCSHMTLTVGAWILATAMAAAQVPVVKPVGQAPAQQPQAAKVGEIIIVGFPKSDAAIRKALKLYPGQTLDDKALKQAQAGVASFGATVQVLDTANPQFKDLLVKEQGKSESSSLEKMISEALKNNPDIRLAEVKLREAQAERDRTRLQVAGDVGTLLAEIGAAEAAQKEGYDRWVRAKKLFDKGAIAQEDYSGAVLTRDKLIAELAAKKAKLPYLVGKVAVDERKADENGATAGNMTADALKSNPDILYAETKVQAAEAMLYRARLQVVAEVAVMRADLDAARAAAQEGRDRWTRAKILFERGAIAKEDYGAAEAARDRLAADVAVKEAKLSYLLGKQSAATDPNIGYYPAALVLIAKANAATTDEEFLRRATLDLHGRVPSPEEMKAFLKLPEKDRRAKWIEQNIAATANVHGPLSAWFTKGHGCIQCHRIKINTAMPAHESYLIDLGIPLYTALDHTLAFGVKRSIRPDSPMTEKLRKALDTPVTLKDSEVSFVLLFDLVREVLPGVNVQVRAKGGKKASVAYNFKNAIPAGAFLQFIEDESDVVFVLRDYGIVVVAADEKLPPGAMRVLDFWKQGKAPESKDPPITGRIEKLDPKDSSKFALSIGTNAGLKQGSLYQILRAADPSYAGSFRVDLAGPLTSVGRVVWPANTANPPVLQENEQVYLRLIPEGNAKASK